MVRKAVGFSVDKLTKVKGRKYPKSTFIDGGMTKEKALQLAMRICTSTASAEIDREYEITDKNGDIEYDSKIYGIVKQVKRKSGIAYTITLYDKDGWESYTYDLKADGRMTNRR